MGALLAATLCVAPACAADNAETLAERFKAAAGVAAEAQARSDAFADSVEIYHTPIRPEDGPVDGAWLRSVSQGEVAALSKAMPDYHQENVRITTIGNLIESSRVEVGTLKDGAKLRLRRRTTFVIHGGRIVGVHTIDDPDQAQTAKLARAYRDGGLVAKPRP